MYISAAETIVGMAYFTSPTEYEGHNTNKEFESNLIKSILL